MTTRITVESLQLNPLGQWSPSRAASCVEYVREMYPRSGAHMFNPEAVLRWASSPREAYHRCVDLPPSGPITAEDVVRECFEQERRAMSSSTPAFVVSPELHTATIAAATTLTASDIEGLSPEDFEFLDAMVLFPYPVWFTSPGHRYVSEVSALTLRSRAHAIMTSAGVDAVVPAVQNCAVAGFADSPSFRRGGAHASPIRYRIVIRWKFAGLFHQRRRPSFGGVQ